MGQNVLLLGTCAVLVIGVHDSGWSQDLEHPFAEPVPQPRQVGTPADRTPFNLQRLQTIESRLHELERRPASGLQSSLSHGLPLPIRRDRLEGVSHSLISNRLEEEGESFQPRFYTDYDRGFVIRPFDAQETPFELKVRTRMQFRYVDFSRDVKTWTDNAGVTRPVDARNDFEIERARLDFAGFFFDPNLQYYINIDADTDDDHDAKFHDFWINYDFNDALRVHVGKAFVPGSRDWLMGSTVTHLVDRSVATTFFRPDRTIGVWAIGEPVEGLHYRAMLGNGFNTTDLRPRDIDEQFMCSGSLWWEPLGDFGKGYADLENHECLVIRVGNSFTHASHNPRSNGTTYAEQNFVRLSDGTRLIDAGALASGATVNAFDVNLYAVDFSAKYRGWSMNSEYFFRWLNDFSSTGGPIPHTDLYDDGFYTDVGAMLIPDKLELIGRISAVDGFFGDAWEYATGINWYINGKHSNKLTFDITTLKGNPSNNSSPNYEVGQDGILYRIQWQAATY